MNEVESGAAEANTESSVAEVNTTQRSKSPKRKSAKTGKPKKKPRLCDVVEQSNEQMKELKDYMQSNSVTVEARSKEREEDQVFFSPNDGHDVPNYDGDGTNACARRWPRISTNPGV